MSVTLVVKSAQNKGKLLFSQQITTSNVLDIVDVDAKRPRCGSDTGFIDGWRADTENTR